MLPALTASDLTVMADEPRVRDLDLAERLGFSLARDIRQIIRRNGDELAMHGEVFGVTPKTSPKGGRPGVEFWLNEPQALLVCMFSRTPKAAEVRRQVVGVFLAWRRGELDRAAPPAAPAPAPVDPWSMMERRLAALEAAVGFAERIQSAPLADAITHLPIWSNGRRPNFWRDPEVRAFIVANHRRMTIDDAVAVMRDRFGPSRTPGRSTIGGFWKRLDAVRSGSTENRRPKVAADRQKAGPA